MKSKQKHKNEEEADGDTSTEEKINSHWNKIKVKCMELDKRS